MRLAALTSSDARRVLPIPTNVPFGGRLLPVVLGACVLLGGCGGSPDPVARRSDRSPAADAGLERLVTYMTGSFSSAAQAARDDAYYDIRLEMWPIWPERTDSTGVHWLYVEQAMAGREEQPYRQRVYRVRAREDGTYESAVFTLPGEGRFVGARNDAARFATLTPDSLRERVGCELPLRPTADGVAFEGGTDERTCASELRGATYATSWARVFAEGLDTWDRGFDDAGRQVWGATEGPYEFRRRLP